MIRSLILLEVVLLQDNQISEIFQEAVDMANHQATINLLGLDSQQECKIQEDSINFKAPQGLEEAQCQDSSLEPQGTLEASPEAISVEVSQVDNQEWVSQE